MQLRYLPRHHRRRCCRCYPEKEVLATMLLNHGLSKPVAYLMFRPW